MIDDSNVFNREDGISSGAITVLVIAAIAITSVVITLFCMLMNNKRGRRVARRVQVTNPTGSVTLSRPTSIGSEPPLPIYSLPTDDVHQGPKYCDAPPSYDEAVNTPAHSPSEASERQTIEGQQDSARDVSTVTVVDESGQPSPRQRY